MTKAIHSLGIMSGTSFDGVDLALCKFTETNGKWNYRIIKAETAPYPAQIKKRIQSILKLSPSEFLLLNNEYGRFLGNCCNVFLKKIKVRPDIISSHGHTIFHQPDNNFTFQMGSGAEIAATTGITTICDFRTLDVALNGQGAPLVPIGDELLFGEYTQCLNIGGIANISANHGGVRKAWDIAPANIALNYLAGLEGRAYDKNGLLARSGKFQPALFDKLNRLKYYRQHPPKSLGREWFEISFIPILERFKCPVKDKLNTVTKHIAFQISLNCIKKKGTTTLCTGGGTHNVFLIDCMREYLKNTIIIPDKAVIDYKEALIFAFLGVLRLTGQTNCLKSVTGAKTDSCSGIIYSIR